MPPVIKISNGKIVLTEQNKVLFQDFADEHGARELGKFLKQHKYWLYSSSVDNPTEYGGSGIDFDKTIVEGFNS